MRSTKSAGTQVALLLFSSGFCALVYQTAWLRMFRLIFGASTLASAAVLALFMAGLGFGGLFFGPRADRHRSPLGLYASLEAGIALSAALSPLLVAAVRAFYVQLGGSEQLGLTGGTIVRLLLSALVLGVPTFLMGGTLPAVARAMERVGDDGRRVVGRLYAVNTLGAVLGVLATTFYSLEHLGVRKSLWLAALLNLLVVVAARAVARGLPGGSDGASEPASPVPAPEEAPAVAAPEREKAPPKWLVPVAAGVVGFAFLLMELVWYRLLGPLLGGSSYTFGLILAVALLGIGLGGALYGAGETGRPRPTLLSFAGTCTLEALCMVVPFALGDRLALLAAFLRPLSAAGFFPLVGGWTVVTCLVVFLPAVVAGYQFPLLIALLGRGRERVGREVGVAYAANTLGAIVGSIAGGFGLLPLLTAPGVWRLVVVLLSLQGAVALAFGFRLREGRSQQPDQRASRGGWAALAGALAVLLLFAEGPTAFFRHTPIGAGRFDVSFHGPNEIRKRIEEMRNRIVWEADGVESAVGLDLSDEYAFIVNGKSDGAALSDGPTQVLSGLVGALLHPQPKRVLVIGLGTGSTAGWLAQVPGVERVDVVELEGTIRHVAEVLSPINRDVLRNPKVRLVIGDGREFLLTVGDSYDLVFSEPSNPYRAGVASLFSADFYRAVRRRLRPGGLLLQWMQGYEVDAQAVRTVHATLNSVFPAVESWHIHRSDLLLVSSEKPVVHDFDRIRIQMEAEPFRSSFSAFWGTRGLEGFYAGFLASPPLAAAFHEAVGSDINTDDRSVLEFAFAKNLGRFGLFQISQLRDLARRSGFDRPILTQGTPPNWERVEEMRVARGVLWQQPVPDARRVADPAAERRIAARLAYEQGNLQGACDRWFEQPAAPGAFADQLLVADCLILSRDPRAPQALYLLEREHPIEAGFGASLWHQLAGRPEQAGEAMLAAFSGYRRDPFVYRSWVGRGIEQAPALAQANPELARRLYDALGEPFVADMFHQPRLLARVEVSRSLRDPAACLSALAPFQRHPEWSLPFLSYREQCYRANRSPLLGRAESDLASFLAEEPPGLAERVVH